MGPSHVVTVEQSRTAKDYLSFISVINARDKGWVVMRYPPSFEFGASGVGPDSESESIACCDCRSVTDC